MKSVVLEIPDDLLASLKVPPEETESRLRTELALRLYQKGLLPFGKARQLCWIDLKLIAYGLKVLGGAIDGSRDPPVCLREQVFC